MGYSLVPMIISVIGTVGLRIVWIGWNIPGASFSGCTVYLLSGILDSDDYHAGDLFLLCA